MEVKEVQKAVEVERNMVMLNVEVAEKRKDQEKEINELVGMISVMLKLSVIIANGGNNLSEYQNKCRFKLRYKV